MNDATMRNTHKSGPLTLRRAAPPLLSLALLLSACNDHDKTASAAPPDVDVAQVLLKEVVQWDEFNGRVSAIESADIKPRVTGYVERMAFREGGPVRKGDVLFELDKRPFKAALEAATAELERARATAQKAQLQDRRGQSLIDARAMSVEEGEARHAARVQSDADVHAAEAAVSTARLNLEYASVRSPIDGRASRAALTVGNLAVADQSVLTSVVSQDPMYIYFDPDEHSYLRYQASLAKHGGKDAGVTARIALANEQDFPREGTVGFIDNQLDPATGTIRARAVVRNADQALTPGLYARVRFAPHGASTAILVDDRAVLTDQDRKYVYALDNGDKAVRKDIVVGRLVDGRRVVEAGLKPSDKIIVSGLQRVFFSGAPVKPKEVRMAQAATAPAEPGATPLTRN
ncbi:efflux RND transporter periplasmic adaptor subunit [Cupriavidus necator]